MRRKLIVLLSLVLLSAPAASAQQNNQLNEQLWEATRRGDAAAVKDLLAKGADVNAKWRYDQTPLFKAAERGHTEVVKVLLDAGAKTDVRDTFYRATPLTWAADKGHAEIVRLLLDKGAPGVEDVLMTGVGRGHPEIVKVALAKGGLSADTLSTALASAERQKRAEIAELLKAAGAQPPPKADFKVDAETLKSYAGAYKAETGPGEVAVSVNAEGKLVVTSQGQPFTLAAFDQTRFRPVEFEGATITFNVEGGKVTGFTFKQGGTTQVFKRVVSSQ